VGVGASNAKDESGEVNISTIASGSSVAVDKIYPIIINPCDATIFTRLANVAMTYQKFTVKSLVFNYIAACSTANNGALAIAFIPDLTSPIPTDYESVLAAGGNWTTSIYEPAVYAVDAGSISKAFKENYCSVPKNVTSQDQINTCGRLIICLHNVAAANAVFGDLKLNYTFTFSDPKMPEVAPALSASYDCAGVLNGAIDLDGLYDTMHDGFHMFGPVTDTAGVYPIITRSACFFMLSGTYVSGGPTFTIGLGRSPAALSAVTPISSVVTTNTRRTLFYKPPGRYYINIISGADLVAPATLEVFSASHLPHWT